MLNDIYSILVNSKNSISRVFIFTGPKHEDRLRFVDEETDTSSSLNIDGEEKTQVVADEKPTVIDDSPDGAGAGAGAGAGDDDDEPPVAIDDDAEWQFGGRMTGDMIRHIYSGGDSSSSSLSGRSIGDQEEEEAEEEEEEEQEAEQEAEEEAEEEEEEAEEEQEAEEQEEAKPLTPEQEAEAEEAKPLTPEEAKPLTPVVISSSPIHVESTPEPPPVPIDDVDDFAEIIGPAIHDFSPNEFIKRIDPSTFAEVLTYMYGEELYNDLIKKKVEFYVVEYEIHPDDSIMDVKSKLLAIDNTFNSLEEIYLYAPITKKITPNEMFAKMSQNDGLSVTKNNAIQYMTMFYEYPKLIKRFNRIVNERNDIHLEDIVAMGLSNIHLINTPIGQEFKGTRNYPIPPNPYNWNPAEINEIVYEYSKHISHKMNKYPLFKFGIIKHRILFATSYASVYSYYNGPNKAIPVMHNLYFPSLTKESGTSNITDDYISSQKLIDVMYSIYRKVGDYKQDIKNYIGIRKATISIEQTELKKIPLDKLFRLIHTSEQVPMTLFYEGKGFHKLYKFYYTKTGTTGKKIPYLNEAEINYTNVNYSRENTFVIYLNVPVHSTGIKNEEFKKQIKHDIRTVDLKQYKTSSKNEIITDTNVHNSFCIVIHDTGKASIYIHRIAPISFQEMREMVVKYAQPILHKIRQYISNSGIHYNTLDEGNKYSVIDNILYQFNPELFDEEPDEITYPNVSIHNVQFVILTPSINRQIDFNATPYKQLLKPIMTVIKPNITDEEFALFRYHHVPTYNLEQAVAEHILYYDSIYKGDRIKIINEIKKYYGFDESKAAQIMANYKATMDDTKVKNIMQTTITGILIDAYVYPFVGRYHMRMNIHNVPNIQYAYIIHMYLQVILHISQTTGDFNTLFGVPLDYIRTLGKAQFRHLDIQEEERQPVEEEEHEEYEGMEDMTAVQFGGRSFTEKELKGQTYGSVKRNMYEYIKATESNKNRWPHIADPRKCPAERQVYILNDEEAGQYRERHPTDFNASAYKIARNTTTNGTKYWITCPSYMCMLNNQPMTLEEVMDGKCGGKKYAKEEDIPNYKASRTVTDFVVRLSTSKQHSQSFLSAVSGTSNICCRADRVEYPRVFKEEDGILVVQNDSVEESTDKESAAKSMSRSKTETSFLLSATSATNPTYIHSADHHNMNPHEKRKLYPELANIFGIDYNQHIKKSILNAGGDIMILYSPVDTVEIITLKKTISFLDALTSYFYIEHDTSTGTSVIKHTSKYEYIRHIKEVHPTYEELREHIFNSMTIDDFIYLYAGSLIDVFYNDKLDIPDDYMVDIATKSIFIETLKERDDALEYIKRLVNAYTNYKILFQTDKLDLKYYIEFIMKPNPNLFPRGCNITFFHLKYRSVLDAKSKVEKTYNDYSIVCPRLYSSNHTISFYNERPCIFIHVYSHENAVRYYPIMKFHNITRGKYKLTKVFTTKSHKSIIDEIKRIYALCSPSVPSNEVYYKQENIPLADALELVFKYIDKQNELSDAGKPVPTVINSVNISNPSIYGSIDEIYINISHTTKSKPIHLDIVIPIKPSTLEPDIIAYYQIEYGDKPNPLSYKNTVNALKLINRITGLPCEPYKKVVHHGEVHGIYTITGDYVQTVHVSLNDIGSDNLPQIDDADNYIMNDNLRMTKEDREVHTQVRNVYIEDKYFKLFRQLLRTVINDVKYIRQYNEIKQILKDTRTEYTVKLLGITERLKTLLKPFAKFKDVRDSLIDEKEMRICYNNVSSQCNTGICNLKNGVCRTVFPSVNISNPKIMYNEELYYRKLADELIRYGRIYDYVMKPYSYIMFDDVPMDLHEDEFIMADFENAYIENEEPTDKLYNVYNTYYMDANVDNVVIDLQ
jgi:hypothetical protein